MQHKLLDGTARGEGGVFGDKSTAYKKFFVQLFLSHSIVAGGVLVFARLLAATGADLWVSLLEAMLLGGAVGIILTASIVYHMYYLEHAVIDVGQGRTIQRPAFTWPLTQLFGLIQTLDRRIQAAIQEEQAAVERRRHNLQAAVERRRHNLQEASESATRVERQRIARDLHDSIKQQLFSISVSAATAKAYWSKDTLKVQSAIVDIQRVVKEAQVEMQALLQQLGPTPLENTPLADVLRTQAEALGYRSGLKMHVKIGDLPGDEVLPAGTQETIFRLVQEAFANIARHARATSVHVTLQQTERALHLIVADDGQGFDSARAQVGMGLANMRERVVALDGKIEVQSAPGQGTNVHIVVPFVLLEQASEDKAWGEEEIEQAIGRAESGFQIGRVAQFIALFFLASNITNFFGQIPLIAIVACACIAGYGLWQGHSWRRRLLLYKAKDDMEMLKLQQKEEGVWPLALYTLFLMGVFVWESWQGGTENASLFSTVQSIGVVALLPVLIWQGYRTQGRIYGAMSADEMGVEIGYQRRRVARHLRLLGFLALGAVCLVIKVGMHALLVGNLRWITIGLAMALSIACLVVLLDFILLWVQKRSRKKNRVRR
jgi:signal transduction histidine kinase